MQKLRLQLIALLVLAVILPALPIAWTTNELIRRSLDPLLNAEIEEGAHAGLESLRGALQERKDSFRASVLRGDSVDTLTAEEQSALAAKERSFLLAMETDEPTRPGTGEAIRILGGPKRASLGGTEVLIVRVRPADGEPVWLVDPLPEEMIERAARLTGSIRLLESMRRERTKVLRGLLATFLVVYVAVMVLVLGLGLYLTSRITKPIKVLGEGIEKVAGGNLDTRIEEVGGGEMRRLLHDFNEMATRLRSLQKEVVRLERLAAWRQMARRLAHEIKNPLTPIQLSAQQMHDEFRGGASDSEQLVLEATSIIEEEVQRLRTLVSQFSQFARLPEPQMERCSITEMLGDLRGLYGPDRVMLGVPDQYRGIHLACDGEQMRRVFINLINNAITAQEGTGSAEPIEIAVVDVAHGGMVQIEVRDRGYGVPPSERRRIFEPDVTTKPDGMGLGLAIVDSTIRNHGGSISVADREGRGAVFAIRLPLERPDAKGEGE